MKAAGCTVAKPPTLKYSKTGCPKCGQTYGAEARLVEAERRAEMYEDEWRCAEAVEGEARTEADRHREALAEAERRCDQLQEALRPFAHDPKGMFSIHGDDPASGYHCAAWRILHAPAGQPETPDPQTIPPLPSTLTPEEHANARALPPRRSLPAEPQKIEGQPGAPE